MLSGALGALLAALGALLGRSWALLGRSWGAPGPLLALLGGVLVLLDALGALLGRSGDVLGCSWPSLGPLFGWRSARKSGLRSAGTSASVRLLALSSPTRAAAVRSTLNTFTNPPLAPQR